MNKDANLLRLTVRDDAPYVKHLEALKHARAVVDNKPPDMWIYTLLKNKREEYLRMKKLAKENEILLENITAIQRSKGRIDSHNSLAGRHYPFYMTKLLEQISKIEKENNELHEKLKRKEPAVINNQELKKSWRKSVARIKDRSRYKYVVRNRNAYQNDEIDHLFLAPSQGRTQVFIEFTVENGLTLGCVKVLLFDDIVPKLVINFLSGLSQIVEQRKHHEKVMSIQVDKIFPNLYAEFAMPKNDDVNMVQLDSNDYGLPIDCPGALAMIPTHDNQLSSNYALTFKSLTVLNGIFTVFGQLCGGWRVLEVLQGWGRKHGTPIEGVYISNCGVAN